MDKMNNPVTEINCLQNNNNSALNNIKWATVPSTKQLKDVINTVAFL